MECKKEQNIKHCNCTYEGCPKHGICCECIAYHIKNRQLPACCFPDDIEKTYNRSFEKFAELVNNNQIYLLNVFFLIIFTENFIYTTRK